MSTLTILTAEEQAEFENPPHFTDKQRRHSLVMSASEREAAYVYDGLLDNDVDKSDIHSTDTHGYREGIFAASPFMGISYAPRIKNVSKHLSLRKKRMKIKAIKYCHLIKSTRL